MTGIFHLALCYFPPQKSNKYQDGDEDTPFKDLEEDIRMYQQEGLVFVIGDFNARAQDAQASVLQEEGPDPRRAMQVYQKEGIYEREA